jgi:putative ABC transport system permease protein
MSFFRIALKNLLRRRLRTALTLCGVAVGIAAFVALVGFARAFEEQWAKLYESSGTDLAVVQKTFLNTFVDESVGEKLRALPFVAAADPVIVNLMDLTPEVNALVYGWPARSFEMDTLTVLQGRAFQDDKPEVMLGEVLAENLGKKPGEMMDIQGSPFLVAGVFRGGSALEAGAAVLPLGQLQKISDLGGKVTAFHVHLRKGPGGEPDPQRVLEARAAIEAACPGLKALPASVRARNNQLVVLARSMAWGTSLIALFIGALGIANTMAMSVFERTREIGVLRALGWRRSRVMKLILIEAAVLGLVGGCFGVAGGWLALRILESLPFTASFVTSSIPLSHCLEALGIAVVVGLLAGFLPAQRGARLSPVEALRYE